MWNNTARGAVNVVISPIISSGLAQVREAYGAFKRGLRAGQVKAESIIRTDGRQLVAPIRSAVDQVCQLTWRRFMLHADASVVQ